MSYRNTSEAYDFKRFEVKKDNVIKLPEQEIAKPVKQKKASVAKVILFYASILMLLGFSIYSRVQLTEMKAQINKATDQLNVAKSENTRLSMTLESKMSMKNIEDYAQNRLGMTKMSNGQVEYVPFNQGDKSEVLGENVTTTNKIINNFKNIISYIG